MIESFKLPTITPETLTGSIVSFNDEYGGLPLKSCTSLITGYQEGSGTPSPDNVRPLVSFSSANIVNVSDYGSWFRGIYQGIYGFVDLGSLKWTFTERYFRADLPITPKTVNDRETPNAITDSQYTPIDFYSLYNNYGSYDDVFAVTNGTAGSNKLYLRDTSYNDTIAFKTAMSGVYLIYELATPTTPTITPEQFETLCQAFGITGNTHTFTFGQSIYQGYIDWKRGVVVGTWGYIASYNGETLTGEWLCNKAPYEVGTTPPTGSQVAYELATPIEIPLGGINLLSQEGQNNIFCNTGDTEVKRLKVN